MRLLVSLAVVGLLAGCAQAPPEYVSHYSTPTTATTTSAAPIPVTGSFVDDFNRPDTTAGLGEGWDLRTYIDGFPMPPATDGFLRDGHYTYAGASTVYAARQFRGTVRRMGTTGRWRQIGDGGETGVAMAISSNDRLITDMVHFAVNRSTWTLTVRHGGPFEPVSRGDFSPPLELGRDYQFEIEATDTAVTVRVPGQEVTENVDTTGILGDRAFWEEYIKPPPAGSVFDFDTVWAAEEGQPLVG